MAVGSAGGTAQFQSTRPRGARRLRGASGTARGPVSIHAPTRGATRRQVLVCRHMVVSIHAPTRGATPYTSTPAYFGFTFQSTRPRGARRPRARARTRARASFNPRAHEGRDRCSWACRPARRRFNPRAHEGRDKAKYEPLTVVMSFQSTRPRGARRGVDAIVTNVEVFQSTRPRGARPVALGVATGDS